MRLDNIIELDKNCSLQEIVASCFKSSKNCLFIICVSEDDLGRRPNQGKLDEGMIWQPCQRKVSPRISICAVPEISKSDSEKYNQSV